jgi:hypothetical protein
LPRKCLRRLAEADLILHAGDVVGAAVLEELERLAPVEAVAGNMDEPELLAALPERRVVEVEGGGARRAPRGRVSGVSRRHLRAYAPARRFSGG